MIDLIAAAKAVVKLGSAAIAAVTVSTIDCCLGPNCTAGGPTTPGSSLWGRYIDGGIENGIDGRWPRESWSGLGDCVRSRVMVGNGAEAERVAMVEA